MKLTGSYEIKLDKNSIWKALNDPGYFKKKYTWMRKIY